ncbi:MAG: ATP-binding protein [Desulfobacula sp.]|nr:ATP-binding protein [Desulfobacula sp.]
MLIKKGTGTSSSQAKFFRPPIFFFGYAGLSFVIFISFCWVTLIQGTTGISLDFSQKGFYVSSVEASVETIKPGDLIVQVNHQDYDKRLYSIFLSPFSSVPTHDITILRNSKKIMLPLEARPLSLIEFIASAFPFLLVILVLFVLSLTAFTRSPADQPSHIFLISMISFAIAVSADIPFSFGSLQPAVVFWYYIVVVISIWIAFSSWAHFVLRYPEQRDLLTGRPFLIVLFYLMPPLVSILAAWGLADDSSAFFSQLIRVRNWAAPFIIVGTFSKHVFDVYTSSDPSIKNQLLTPLIAAVFGISPYLFLYLLPELIIDRPLISLHTVTLMATSVPLSLCLSLVRYRLFDVDKMVSRIVSYTALIVILSLVYSLVIAGLKRWFFGRSILSEELFLLFTIGTILFFQPAISWIEKYIDRIFYRRRPVPAKIFHEISDKITASLRWPDLLHAIVGELPEKIGITGAALILVEENQSRCYPENVNIEAYPWGESRLFSIFKDTERSFLLTHYKGDEKALENELGLIKKENYTLVFPLKSTRSSPGFLIIGPRKDGRFFREEDLHLFSSFANQAAIALENAMRYETLIESKRQLEELFSQKVHKEKMVLVGEMSTMLAHELKNPLGIIHSSAQYLEQGKESETVKKEMLHYIMDEVEHLSMTITSLLGLAKQRPPVLGQIDLNKELPRLVLRWRHSDHHNPEIDIECRIKEYLPTMYGDLRQLTQVLHNLINNSEDMMPDGGNVILEAAVYQDKIELNIKDTGPGIENEHKDKVFNNFFTTKEKGLGLGLVVCRQLISAHSGTIQLFNRTIKGVTVRIRLPLKPLATGVTKKGYDLNRAIISDRSVQGKQ